MGQTLSEPDTAKDTSTCQNHLYKVGSSCMQGWRINMEDSHTHILSLPDDPGTAFFAVYDGHGGATIAEYAGKNLHKVLTKQSQYQDGHIDDAMRHAFLEIDDIMLQEESLKTEQAGSTAVAMVVKDNRLYCANVGDSRAIACVNGRVEQLSFDHKPTNEIEFNRITAAGGWVDCDRVNGNLALSRALGDFVFKRNEKKQPEEQIVTAYPDVEVRTITEDWEFIVLACDGIWDVMKNEEVVAFVRDNIAAGLEPDEICEGLMMKCLAPDCLLGGIGCDNMTVVIIGLLHDRPYADLMQRCSKVYANPDGDDRRVEEMEAKPRSPTQRGDGEVPDTWSETPSNEATDDRASKEADSGIEDVEKGEEQTKDVHEAETNSIPQSHEAPENENPDLK